jgi:hypothetical protein
VNIAAISRYPDELTREKMIQTGVTAQRINALILAFEADGITLETSPKFARAPQGSRAFSCPPKCVSRR